MSTTPSSCSNIMYVRCSCRSGGTYCVGGGSPPAPAGTRLGGRGARHRGVRVAVASSASALARFGALEQRAVGRRRGRSSSTSAGACDQPAPSATSGARRARHSRRRCRARGAPPPPRRARRASGRESAPPPSPDARSRRPRRRRRRRRATARDAGPARIVDRYAASAARTIPLSRIGRPFTERNVRRARRADVGGTLDEPADVHRAAHVVDVDHAVRRRTRPRAPRRDRAATRAAGSASAWRPSCVTVKRTSRRVSATIADRVDDRRAIRSARRAGISDAPARCRTAATRRSVVPRRRATSRTSITDAAGGADRACPRRRPAPSRSTSATHGADRRRAPRRESRSSRTPTRSGRRCGSSTSRGARARAARRRAPCRRRRRSRG